jgi:hypothetical protein
VGSLATTSTRKAHRDEQQTDLVLNPAGNIPNEAVKYGDAPSCNGVEWYSAGDNHGAEGGQLDTDQSGVHLNERRMQKEEGPRPQPPIFTLTGLVNSRPACFMMATFTLVDDVICRVYSDMIQGESVSGPFGMQLRHILTSNLSKTILWHSSMASRAHALLLYPSPSQHVRMPHYGTSRHGCQ